MRVNNRKVLDGVLEAIGLGGDGRRPASRLTVLRAIDKLDRLGPDGVRAAARRRAARTRAATSPRAPGSAPTPSTRVLAFRRRRAARRAATLDDAARASSARSRDAAREGVAELAEIAALRRAPPATTTVDRIDPSVVRGLEYYTGPVFEAELTFEVTDEDGQPVRFGSVGGGGRYDGLVGALPRRARAGDRLLHRRLAPAGGAEDLGKARRVGRGTRAGRGAGDGPDQIAALPGDARRCARPASAPSSISAASGMKAQMKYADRRGSPCVVIQGSDERARGEVQIKDLIEGAKAAEAIASNEEWKAARPAQFSVSQDKLVEAVREVLSRHFG